MLEQAYFVLSARVYDHERLDILEVCRNIFLGVKDFMKNMSKGLLMTALICGTMNMTAYAQTTAPQEFVLDEYVVTAARTEIKLVDTPANVTVVDASKIEEGRYSDVSEVLKDVPGATVIDDGTGATEKKIYLNGDDRVLVMVDGRRVNFDVGAANGRSSYDMNMLPDVSLIERIEVVKGHGGSLYGSDAVGGVINIITKKADHDFGKVSVGFGSNDTRDMKAMYSFKENKTGVIVSASKYEQGYYKYKDVADDATKRWPGDSGFETEKIGLKVAQELTADSNLEIGYDHGKMEGTSLSYIGSHSYTETDKTTDNFYAKYDWLLKNQDSGYIQIYNNNLDYKAITSPVSHYKEKNIGIDAQQTITTSDTNKIVIGSSWRKSDVDNKGKYDESIDNLALFVNNQWEFAPTWTLNAGARLDHHNEFGSETTFSAGLNKKLDDSSHVYVNWGQIFKAPTTDDLYTYFKGSYKDWIDGTIHETLTKGDPNLKPEKGDSWTIGYGTVINDKTNVNVSYFQSDVEDAIIWDYTSVPYLTFAKNVAEQKKRGMELSVSHKLNDNFDVEASYTYVRSKNDEGKGFVRDANAIPNTYRLGIRYHDVKWNAGLFLRAGSGAETNRYSYIESSFVTVDMAVSYKATEDLTVFAKGYNLFNEAYAEHGGVTGNTYKYPAQARRFIAGVEYSF